MGRAFLFLPSLSPAMYDHRTIRSSVSVHRANPLDSIFANRPVARLLALLCFVACLAVVRADTFSHAANSSVGQPGGAGAGRRAYVRVAGTPHASIQIYAEGQHLSFPGWQQATVGIMGGREDYYQWSNNASTNSTGVQATTTGITKSVRWRIGSSGQEQTVPVNIPAAADKVVYGGSASFKWIDLPPIILTFNGLELVDVEVPGEEKMYKEGWILIDNQTGKPMNIKFGDETITAEPGVNVYPFYGEVDPSTGLPKGFPPGFIGEVVKGPDGQNYFGGRLGFHDEGGVEWQPFPFTIGPPPASGQGPILNTPAPSGNGNNQYQLPPGMTPGGNLPLPPGMTPGGNLPLPSGVGQGGTGSSPNPNVPAGPNGSLPNGVISGGAGNLPPGVSPGVVSNPNGSQTGTGNMGGGAAAPDTEGTADGSWGGGDPVLPDARHNIAGKIQSLRGTITGKLQGVIPDFGSGGLPRTNVLTVNIPVGTWGNLNQSLDFSQTPFPQIRLMLLVFLTAITAVSFFKKVTI